MRRHYISMVENFETINESVPEGKPATVADPEKQKAWNRKRQKGLSPFGDHFKRKDNSYLPDKGAGIAGFNHAMGSGGSAGGDAGGACCESVDDLDDVLKDREEEEIKDTNTYKKLAKKYPKYKDKFLSTAKDEDKHAKRWNKAQKAEKVEESLLAEEDNLSREDAEEIEALARAAKNDERLRNSNLLHAAVETAKQDENGQIRTEKFRKPKNKFYGELTEDVEDYNDMQFSTDILVHVETVIDGAETIAEDKITDCINTFSKRAIDLFSKHSSFAADQENMNFYITVRDYDEIDSNLWEIDFTFEANGHIMADDLKAEMSFVLGKIGTPSYEFEQVYYGKQLDVDKFETDITDKATVTIYPLVSETEVRNVDEEQEDFEDDDITDSFKEM